MSLLVDILTQYPNCRVTIGGPTRRKPQTGDRKYTKRRGWLIRRRQTYQGMDCTRNGRPVYEWVEEASLSAYDLSLLRAIGRDRGARDLTPKGVTKPTEPNP